MLLTYIYRGFKYAVTSACAIIAGYLMRAEYPTGKELWSLSIPIASSVVFFICYANRFHDSENIVGNERQEAHQSDAVIASPIFLLLYVMIVVLKISPPSTLLIAFGLYMLLSIAYGLFLLKYREEKPLPLVRHQLVWPVVLTIGISLYYGLTYEDLVQSTVPLVPVIMVLVLFLTLSRSKLSRKLFVRLNLSISFLVTCAAIVSQFDSFPFPVKISQYISTMLFCVSIAAYLAVFEAWKVTSDIARRKPIAAQNVNGTAQVFNPQESASQYSIATLAALTGSIWVIPFYFIFSQYGTFFLIAFLVHALIAFVCWFQFGQGEYLMSSRWPLIKTVFGMFFLGLLVAATIFNSQPSSHFLRGFAYWGGLSLVIPLSGFPCYKLLVEMKRIKRSENESITLKIFANRLNFTRSLCLLSCMACIIISALLDNSSERPERQYKAELAYSAYALCVILCFFVEVKASIDWIPPLSSILKKIADILKKIVGVLLVIRIFTSLMISTIVIVPFIYKGQSIVNACIAALPFFLAAAGGFALNDYYDVPKDRVNKPYRAIPSGKMKPRTALFVAQMLIALAPIIAILTSHDLVELALYGVSIIGVISYNYFVKYLSLSKTFLTAVISSLPFIYVVRVLDYPVIYYIVPIAASLYLLGRELLMDIRDMKGDRSGGITTLPMIVGENSTARLGFLLQMLAGGLLSSLLITFSSLWSSVLVYLILISTLILAWLWFSGKASYRRGIVLSLWLPMLCGILLLCE